MFRIEAYRGRDLPRFTRAHNAGDLNGGLILGRRRRFYRMQFTFQEPLDAVTGVAEQENAAGAVAIHQHRHQLITGGLRIVTIAISGLQQRFNILFAVESLNLFSSSLLGLLPPAAWPPHRRQGGSFLFFDKLFEIVEAVSGSSRQTKGEMAFHPQLFWRGGQQQHASTRSANLFDGHIFTARRIGTPRR